MFGSNCWIVLTLILSLLPFHSFSTKRTTTLVALVVVVLLWELTELQHGPHAAIAKIVSSLKGGPMLMDMVGKIYIVLAVWF